MPHNKKQSMDQDVAPDRQERARTKSERDARARDDARVTEASDESFPASDPPAWIGGAATPDGHEQAENRAGKQVREKPEKANDET